MDMTVKKKYSEIDKRASSKWQFWRWQFIIRLSEYIFKQKVAAIRIESVQGGVKIMEHLALKQVKIDLNKTLSVAAVWDDFEKAPVDLIKTRYLCVEFKPELKEQLIEWLKLCRKEAVKRKVFILKIAVFANYDKMSPGELPILVSAIGHYGATIRDCGGNFSEAVKTFDQELLEVDQQTADYSNKRKELIAYSQVPVETNSYSATRMVA